MSPLPPIIGYCGAAGHGKTTAAVITTSTWQQCYRLSFADPIRRMLHCLGLTADDLQRHKEVPHHLLGGKTPRQAMQTLGTDWARNMIDPELWLRVARHHALKIIDGGGVPVFDDVRFDNEASLIRSLGGEVIKVVRAGSPAIAPSMHASERGIDSRFITTTLLAGDYPQLQQLVHSHFNHRRSP